MINIKLIEKKKIGSKDDCSFEKNEKGSIKIEKPDTYNKLKEEIINQFKLQGKEISIKAIDDGDEINIKDEESYDDNKDVEQFIVYMEEEASSSDLSIIEKILDIKDELKNLTNDDSEFKNLLDEQLNIPINYEEFKDEENEKDVEDNALSVDSIIENIKTKIQEFTKKLKEDLIGKIKVELSNLKNIMDDKIKEIESNINTNTKKTSDIKNNVKMMLKAIDSLKKKKKDVKENKKNNELEEEENKKKEEEKRKKKEEEERKKKEEEERIKRGEEERIKREEERQKKEEEEKKKKEEEERKKMEEERQKKEEEEKKKKEEKKNEKNGETEKIIKDYLDEFDEDFNLNSALENDKIEELKQEMIKVNLDKKKCKKLAEKFVFG